MLYFQYVCLTIGVAVYQNKCEGQREAIDKLWTTWGVQALAIDHGVCFSSTALDDGSISVSVIAAV